MKLLFSIFLFLFSFQSYGDDYKPDDASCLEYEKKTCAEIDPAEYKNCPFDYMGNNFTLDDQHRIIAVRGPSISFDKRGDFMIKKVKSVGCAHYSDQRSYYFNDDLDDEKSHRNFTCEKLMSLVNKIDDKFDNPRQKCILANPKDSAFAKQCDVVSMTNAKKEYGDNYSCGQALVMANGGFVIEKSDVAGYKFMISETGYEN
ncbi:MAG: hypothetical protein KGQ36_07240 [Rickettsiales bacterium]|nr:hypothetical protein [Rickettsiales bacterium]